MDEFLKSSSGFLWKGTIFAFFHSVGTPYCEIQEKRKKKRKQINLQHSLYMRILMTPWS